MKCLSQSISWARVFPAISSLPFTLIWLATFLQTSSLFLFKVGKRFLFKKSLIWSSVIPSTFNPETENWKNWERTLISATYWWTYWKDRGYWLRAVWKWECARNCQRIKWGGGDMKKMKVLNLNFEISFSGLSEISATINVVWVESGGPFYQEFAMKFWAPNYLLTC